MKTLSNTIQNQIFSQTNIILVISLILISIFSSCEQLGLNQADIYHESLNQEYVLIRDTELLQQSDDPISRRVDSIISGFIDETFISTGQKSFDLDESAGPDFAFEIIDLNQFNAKKLPVSFDSLAARVIPITGQVLDNSTYGYPDAMMKDETISEDGNWSSGNSVLGTFMNAGQFQGRGERFLGVRFPLSRGYSYGWIRIYCSQHNDTLRIIDYAYNLDRNGKILAGQTE